MEHIDVNKCIEILQEIIEEQGDVVFSLSWDSGSPGAKAGVDFIYKFRDYFWRVDEFFGFAGPYDDFEDPLLMSEEYIYITSAMEHINCSELQTKELIKKMKIIDLEEKDIDIIINGEKWRFGVDGSIRCMELIRIK